MAEGLLPKAYLRLDPNIDQVHPIDLEPFIRLLCAANRQAQRGRFRDRATIEAIVGKPAAARLIARGDLVQLVDKRWYLDGWDEWQEGDWTVGERTRRLRAKRANGHADVTVAT